MNHLLRLCALGIFAFLVVVTPVHAQDIKTAIPTSDTAMKMSFAPLVKKSAPAVMNIYAKVKVRRQVGMISPFFNDPFFSQFFGGMGGPVQERIESSLGSGVIVDKTGLIATNSHVVKNATEIVAVTMDGREYDAEKILIDEKTDLAILRIDPKGDTLPVMPMADSDALSVGDLVLAIGNPFGVGQTVTSGIISGLARSVAGPEHYSSFIQTDAAINPGNSGGALIDMNGHLIGINTMIFSKSGGSLGIGFAIPSNMVKTVVDASRTGQKVIRPWTGVIGQKVTSDMVEGLQLDRVQGALITKVMPGGPADKAGVKSGDVVLQVDDKPILDPAEMRFHLATLKIGQPVELLVSRQGTEIKLTMLTEVPPETPPRDTTTFSGNNPFAGATVVNISPAVIEDIGILPVTSGVVIEDGGANRLGLTRGDIIQNLNGKDIETVAQLKTMIAQPSPVGWKIVIQRGPKIINMVVR